MFVCLVYTVAKHLISVTFVNVIFVLNTYLKYIYVYVLYIYIITLTTSSKKSSTHRRSTGLSKRIQDEGCDDQPICLLGVRYVHRKATGRVRKLEIVGGLSKCDNIGANVCLHAFARLCH